MARSINATDHIYRWVELLLTYICTNATALVWRCDKVFSGGKVSSNFRWGSVRMQNTGHGYTTWLPAHSAPHRCVRGQVRISKCANLRNADWWSFAPLHALFPREEETAAAVEVFTLAHRIRVGHAERTLPPKNRELHLQAMNLPDKEKHELWIESYHWHLIKMAKISVAKE